MQHIPSATGSVASRPPQAGRTKSLAIHSFLGAIALASLCASTARAEDITVASIQSSTGVLSFAGAQEQKAIRLAVEEINQKGGIHGNKITLLERDDGSDKGQAINLANQAVDRDRALLTLGPTATSNSVAVAPIFNEKRAPVLSFATSDAVLAAGPWSLKFQQSAALSIPMGARYALQKTAIRKVAIVYDRTNEGMIEFKNFFRNPFKAGGGTIVTEEAVVSSDSNFLPLATKLKSMDVDAIYLSMYAEQSANLLVQLRKAGISDKVKFIGTIALVSPKFLSIAGKAAEGTFTVADYVYGMGRPLNKSFEAAYRARYKEEPDNWAALGYSLAQVGLAAIRDAGPNPTREKVRDAYQKLRDVPVLIGSGLWNVNDRRPNYGGLVLTVKDGKFVMAP